MTKTYVRWGGFRVKHQGVDTGAGRAVGFGYLCAQAANADNDVPVQIFHVQGTGYTYKELP